MENKKWWLFFGARLYLTQTQTDLSRGIERTENFLVLGTRKAFNKCFHYSHTSSNFLFVVYDTCDPVETEQEKQKMNWAFFCSLEIQGKSGLIKFNLDRLKHNW